MTTRRFATALTAAAATLALAAPAALAVPPGHAAKGGEPFTCDGMGAISVYGGNGRSGWVGDDNYQAREVHVVGTFTPTGSSESFPVEFHKVYGGGPAGDAVHCTANVSEVEDDGTFTGTVEVWAVKVPGH